MQTCLQQARDELGVVLLVSDRQIVMRKFLGLSGSPNTVRWVSEENLDSSVENKWPSVKAARTYQITASALMRSKVRITRLQQVCHARLRKNIRTARALPGSAL